MIVEYVDRFEIKLGPHVDWKKSFALIHTAQDSTILVRPMPWGIHLTGFAGYTLGQKRTWELERSTFRRLGRILSLFVPNEAADEGTSIPLARVGTDDPSLLQLDYFVTHARAILQRPLPTGVEDKD